MRKFSLEALRAHLTRLVLPCHVIHKLQLLSCFSFFFFLNCWLVVLICYICILLFLFGIRHNISVVWKTFAERSGWYSILLLYTCRCILDLQLIFLWWIWLRICVVYASLFYLVILKKFICSLSFFYLITCYYCCHFSFLIFEHNLLMKTLLFNF